MKAKGVGKPTPKYSSDNDDGYDELDPDEQRHKSSAGKDRNPRRPVSQPNAKTTARTRPTNNQLLYKAYFRWHHYPWKIRNGHAGLPTETDACPSVLQQLSKAEVNRTGPHRNILQILSTNTRRTKVVELSSGTHRVPDELKRHYLADGENGKYHTNLDRNRYGNDDQYLFTERNQPEGYPGEPPVSSNPNANGGIARNPPVKRPSRLWSMGLSNQDDSLQNALDAFKKMDMPFSPSFSLLNSNKAEDEIASDPAQLLDTNEVSFRKRSRKPLLRASSSQLLNQDSSLLSGPLPDSGLREKSGENGSGRGEDGGEAPAPTSLSNGDDSEDPVVAKVGEARGGAYHQNGDESDDPDDFQPPHKHRRVRYVARQSSAVNLGTRMAPAELKRLAAEVEFWRQESKQLETQMGQLKDQHRVETSECLRELEAQQLKYRELESKVNSIQQEMQVMAHSKKAAEEKASSSFALNSMLAKLLMQNANGSAALAALMTSAGNGLNGMAGGMEGLPWHGMGHMQPAQAAPFHPMLPGDMLPPAALQQQMQAGHGPTAAQQQASAMFSGIPSWSGEGGVSSSSGLPAMMLGQPGSNGFAGMLALQQQQLAGMAAAQAAANPLLQAAKKGVEEFDALVGKKQAGSGLELGQVGSGLQLPDFPALHTGIAQLAK